MSSKDNVLKAIRRYKVDVGVAQPSEEYQVLATNISEVDQKLLGIGGFPRGTIIELGGPSNSGKSAFVYNLIRREQEEGGVAALFDAENAYSHVWGNTIGINNEELIKPPFTSGEEAFSKMYRLVDAGVGLIVIDSIARLIPNVDIERIFKGVSKMPGAHAQLMNAGFGVLLSGARIEKKHIPRLRDTGTIIIAVNHTTASFDQYVTYHTSGGKASSFDPHLRISCHPRGFSKEKDAHGIPLRQKLHLQIEKTRLSWAGRVGVDLWLSNVGSFEVAEDSTYLYDLAKGKDWIDISGAWVHFKWKGVSMKINGKSKFIDFCEENSDFKEALTTADSPPEQKENKESPKSDKTEKRFVFGQ